MPVNVVLINNKYEGYYAVSDQLKPEIKTVTNNLNIKKIKTLMITGDNNVVAKVIANALVLVGGLNMVWATIFMEFSSIIVLLNALHLRREYEYNQRRKNDIK